MIGSFLTRALVLALGYAYPAYECFKTVEKNKPEIEQLLFWCQYWILVATLTVFERVGDTFISWLPMYSEAKLAFFIYLWYPKTRGTTYVYETFLRPYVAKHETEIDRNLLELRARAGDVLVLNWQRAATYGQTRFLEILQYVASQSQAPRPRPSQQRQQQQQLRPPSAPGARLPAAESLQPQSPRVRLPPSPAKSQVEDTKQEENHMPAPLPQSQLPSSPSHTSSSGTSHLATGEAVEPAQVEASKNSSKDESDLPQETILEETIRVTRGRLRKTRSSTISAPTAAPTVNQNN